MIPAIFGAEGGGRPGKGQVVGKHSRKDLSRMAQGSVGTAFDEESCVARVNDSGETEKRFPSSKKELDSEVAPVVRKSKNEEPRTLKHQRQ